MEQNGGNKSAGGSGGGCLEQSPADSKKPVKVHTSFRINPIVEIFSKMKGEKEDILKEIGLHGLTNLPREEPTTNRSFDWQFAYWLLQHMDSESGCLDLGVRGHLEFRCEDVELVIGIPCSGAELKKSNPLVIQATKNLVKQRLLLSPEDELNLDNIVRVLEREITPDTHGGHRKAFIMAAYIFAVSYFLAPKGRPPKVNNEILECILDTDELKNINWSSYVLMSLREASAKLKREVEAKTKTVTLDGCLLLLQVLYLDNMNFRVLSTRHDIIPRVKEFSFEKLRELINADKKKLGGAGITVFGIRQLRCEEDTLYTRGDIYRSILISKQRISNGLFLESDKAKIMDYMRRNVDEGKRRVRIASRQFEEHATKILEECNSNVATLLDVWLKGRIVGVGNTCGQVNNDAAHRYGQGREDQDTDNCDNASRNRGRYKTMTKRPSKVRKLDNTSTETPQSSSWEGIKSDGAAKK